MSEAFDRSKLEYKGISQPRTEPCANNQLTFEPYIPDQDLIDAVNLAIYLKRPLLIKGEPGGGKTRLARAVAYELCLDYQPWHIKSTSRARDGIYTYDTIGRLRDAQLAATKHLNEQEAVRLEDPQSYIKWGPLGVAFRSEKPTVVLIDEIDKADIDFPNDLLLELDELRFKVDEVNIDEKEWIEVRPGAEPIVFITSNEEKDLPDAFLRRCLFHYVKFPKEHLRDIILAHFPEPDPELVTAAVNRFLELRNEMENDKGESGKKVSTSELIDWFRVLRRYPSDEMLEKLHGTLPFASVLLKSWDDYNNYYLSKTRR